MTPSGSGRNATQHFTDPRRGPMAVVMPLVLGQDLPEMLFAVWCSKIRFAAVSCQFEVRRRGCIRSSGRRGRVFGGSARCRDRSRWYVSRLPSGTCCSMPWCGLALAVNSRVKSVPSPRFRGHYNDEAVCVVAVGRAAAGDAQVARAGTTRTEATTSSASTCRIHIQRRATLNS